MPPAAAAKQTRAKKPSATPRGPFTIERFVAETFISGGLRADGTYLVESRGGMTRAQSTADGALLALLSGKTVFVDFNQNLTKCMPEDSSPGEVLRNLGAELKAADRQIKDLQADAVRKRRLVLELVDHFQKQRAQGE